MHSTLSAVAGYLVELAAYLTGYPVSNYGLIMRAASILHRLRIFTDCPGLTDVYEYAWVGDAGHERRTRQETQGKLGYLRCC